MIESHCTLGCGYYSIAERKRGREFSWLSRFQNLSEIISGWLEKLEEHFWARPSTSKVGTELAKVGTELTKVGTELTKVGTEPEK